MDGRAGRGARAVGTLSLIGTVGLESDPPYLSTDRKGRFLLSAYYQAGKVAVHPIGEDGAVHGPPVEWRDTGTGAPSGRFVYAPNRGHNSIANTASDRANHDAASRAQPTAGAAAVGSRNPPGIPGWVLSPPPGSA